jgi:DNA-binding transcriptional MerR regulator
MNLSPRDERRAREVRAPGETLLRISELARRCGVSRATIQHYMREGLLPTPVKTGRTMAYYDPACVERILLIKDLQRRYLPLGVIRRLVQEPESEGPRPVREIEALKKEISAALQPAERPLMRDEVQGQLGLSSDVLGRLEAMGIVRSERVWDKDTFSPPDVAVLRAVAKLEAGGITHEVGFKVEDITMYQDAMISLLAKEVAAFGRSVQARRSRADVARLAIAAATGATELILAIRNKLIGELVSATPSRKRRGERSVRRGHTRL